MIKKLIFETRLTYLICGCSSCENSSNAHFLNFDLLQIQSDHSRTLHDSCIHSKFQYKRNFFRDCLECVCETSLRVHRTPEFYFVETKSKIESLYSYTDYNLKKDVFLHDLEFHRRKQN